MELNELKGIDDLKLEEFHQLAHNRVEIFLDANPSLLDSDPVRVLKKER